MSSTVPEERYYMNAQEIGERAKALQLVPLVHEANVLTDCVVALARLLQRMEHSYDVVIPSHWARILEVEQRVSELEHPTSSSGFDPEGPVADQLAAFLSVLESVERKVDAIQLDTDEAVNRLTAKSEQSFACDGCHGVGQHLIQTPAQLDRGTFPKLVDCRACNGTGRRPRNY